MATTDHFLITLHHFLSVILNFLAGLPETFNSSPQISCSQFCTFPHKLANFWHFEGEISATTFISRWCISLTRFIFNVKRTALTRFATDRILITHLYEEFLRDAVHYLNRRRISWNTECLLMRHHVHNVARWFVLRSFMYISLCLTINSGTDSAMWASVAGILPPVSYPVWEPLGTNRDFDIPTWGGEIWDKICENLYVKQKILQSVTFCFHCTSM